MGKTIVTAETSGDGNNRGFRILGWTGEIYRIEKEYFDDAKDLKLINRPGIYFFLYKNSNGYKKKVYVGQADIRGDRSGVYGRMGEIHGEDENDEINDWSVAVALVATDDVVAANLNYLEGTFYDEIVESSSYDNLGEKPPAGEPHCSEDALREVIANTKYIFEKKLSLDVFG